MRMSRAFSLPIAALSTVVVCSASPKADTPVAKTNTAADSQLGRFLNVAIASRRQQKGMWDSVYTCVGPDREDWQRVRWIADYRIKSTTPERDSIKGEVALTYVAEQSDEGFAGWMGRVGVREVVGHFTLVRDSTDGAWKVCGETDQKYGVRMMSRVTPWAPGGSAERARALVDSVRQARGLAIVR